MGTRKGAGKPLLQLLLCKDSGQHARKTPEKTRRLAHQSTLAPSKNRRGGKRERGRERERERERERWRDWEGDVALSSCHDCVIFGFMQRPGHNPKPQ